MGRQGQETYLRRPLGSSQVTSTLPASSCFPMRAKPMQNSPSNASNRTKQSMPLWYTSVDPAMLAISSRICKLLTARAFMNFGSAMPVAQFINATRSATGRVVSRNAACARLAHVLFPILEAARAPWGASVISAICTVLFVPSAAVPGFAVPGWWGLGNLQASCCHIRFQDTGIPWVIVHDWLVSAVVAGGLYG